jgi:hypothetical protein
MSATAVAPLAEGTSAGEDPDEGKLFEVPKAAVLIDESDPNVIKIAFSSGVELDRADTGDVEFYNALKAGSYRDLKVTVFCAGPQNVHRRDSEGDVDAIVQTKALKVTDISTTVPPLKEPERKQRPLDDEGRDDD